MPYMFHTTAPPVRVEVAATAQQRHLGLRNRHRLPWYGGMLFVFPETGNHEFTMRQTFLPLDMIFFDEEFVVVGIVHDAQPLTRGPYGVPNDSRYVLEVSGGWTATHRVELGDHFDYTA